MAGLDRSYRLLLRTPRRPRIAATVFAALTLVSLPACEGPAPKTALNYTEDSKRAYDAAMEEYNAHNWIEAQSQLREVKRKYSYSKYARMAELRIADADYEQEKYAEAIREYKEFIHAHRADAEDVSYARSRIAEATYAQIPESAIIGAAEERDQASVVDAYKELTAYLADYPAAKESPRIRDLLAQVVARLVKHELYVARFYLNRDNYDAAAARVLYALHNYSLQPNAAPSTVSADSDLTAEALLLLGQIYLKMHKWMDARQAFETILHAHGESPIVVQAQGYLQHLKELGA
jgi:outer membrane protein assembly factor BamD